MGLLSGLRGEFVDIIEWLDASRDTIVWRFPRHENEIKNGAKLIVREGQVAIFVNEGQIADVFTPGTWELTTQNLPILSTLRGWKHGFDSPFKAEVYFVSTRTFTDEKWGTQHPVMMRDAEFGMVRVRAFGGYGFKAANPDTLLRELVGTDPSFRTEEVSDYIRQQVVTSIMTALAKSGIAVIDLAMHQSEIAQKLTPQLTLELAPIGLQLTKLVIESVSLPPEVEATIDQRSRMGVLGDLNQYAKLQSADAITMAAQNEGGIAGLGAGMAVGQQMAGQMAGALASPAAPAGPPPLPTEAGWFLGENGAQTGPHTAGSVRARVQEGSLDPSTLAWREGMSGWTAISELAELRPAAPPPLPS